MRRQNCGWTSDTPGGILRQQNKAGLEEDKWSVAYEPVGVMRHDLSQQLDTVKVSKVYNNG